MKNRAIEIVGFLAQAGWGDDAHQTPLRADFSSRRFARLERATGSVQRAVLMDADADQKTDAFVKIAEILRRLDLSAPAVYAADAARGLVLMEDFGDRNVGRMIDSGGAAEPLYRRAVDVLVHLHGRFDLSAVANTGLPVFDAKLFASQVELFLEAYFVLAKTRAATPEETESFRAAWKTVLGPIEHSPRTLMLRDFMPDNLMDLTGRDQWHSIGLLDFQDGGIGPVAYELASLCDVVRRDIDHSMLDKMIDYYCAQAAPGISKGELRNACRILSAQRHMRILGIVANRALKTGQRDKLDYAPRIWEYLGELLRDEGLKPIRQWIDRHFLDLQAAS